MAAPKRGVRIIPQEIITEILYRLPVKSVGRFRCVSKGWLSLLTDPQFIKTHTRNTLNQHHLILSRLQSQFGYDTEGSYFLYSHPFHEIVVTTPTKFNLELDVRGVEQIIISSSCDGLVLVRVYSMDGIVTLLLVNPTTGENLQLPEDFYKVLEMDNVVELETEIMCGFGYDSVTDDYKVVTLDYFSYESDEEDAVQVEGVYVYVYSLRNKTWMRVIDSPYYMYYGTNGVFVNGFIHWIAWKGRSHDDLLVIAAFSLADESFREVPFPKFCNVTDTLKIDDCQLLVLGGKLAIFLQKKGEIWLMNEYGVRESWTKISLHGINKIPIFKPKPYTIPKPLVMDDNAKILVANSDRMMVYEVEKGTFSETVCVWNPKNLSVLGSYVESLVSLKHNITKQKSTNSSEEKEKEEEDAEDEDVENEDVEDDLEDEDEDDDAEDEGEEDDEDICKGIRANLEFSGEENTHPERQTGKRKDIGSSNAPSKHIRVNSYSGSVDIPEPSSRELLDPELIQHRLEGVVPLHLSQEDLGISNGDLCHRADTDFFNSLHSFEAIRQNLQATGHVVDTLSRDIKEKNVMILDLERKVSQDYDSWKAKHQEEKLRADRLEGEVNHALSKQKFLTHRLEENEATIQSKLVEIQAFERRAREQEFTLVEKNEKLLEKGRALDTANAKIESLKARLAMADQKRRKAMAALQSW